MTILPLCFLPNIKWWFYAAHSIDTTIDLHEIYPKQTFRNRFRLLTANGYKDISIPVQSTNGEKICIQHIEVSDQINIRSIIETIKSSYGRSAFFEHYFEDLTRLIHLLPERSLSDSNLASIHWVQKQLKAPSHLNYSIGKMPYNTYPNDKRLQFEPMSESELFRSYPQVFSDRFGFVNNLSIIDLLFNMGPRALDYIVLEKNR